MKTRLVKTRRSWSALRPHFGWLALLLATPVCAQPQIQHWTTGNGARIYFVPAPELPIVDIRVVFAAGAARDGDHPGIAKLTNGLLTEGAGGSDADTIAESLTRLGAELQTEARRDMAWVGLRSLSEPDAIEPAVDLLAQILGKADLPADAVERVRRQQLVALGQERQSPAKLAERAFYADVFRQHPYASPVNGLQDSLGAMTREDIEAFYRQYYVAKNAVVALVGDLDRAGAEALAERATDALSEGDPPPELPAVASLEASGERFIEYPSTQASIRVGQPGVSRLDPDYFDLMVGNHVLGSSGLNSLLFKEIRERRGLAYSVYSYFRPMSADGPFVIALQTRNESKAQALELLQETLQRFLQYGPTDAQLSAAKKNLTGSFALRIDSNKKLLGQLALIGFYGLPLDYLARYSDRVEAVTVESVREAFGRHIDPAHFLTVVVGPADPSGGDAAQ